MASTRDGAPSGAAHDALAALESITADDLSALRFDELLPALARRLAQVCGARLGAILLLNEANELVPRTVQSEDRPLDDASAPVARDFAVGLLREGRPLAMLDLDTATGADAAVRGLDIRSLVGAPLKVCGRTIGAAYIGLPEAREFSAYELHRFAILADRAALALEHARLLEQTQRYAAEVERVNAELMEVDRLKSEFLSMVSHELRTPLTAILGYTDLLLRQVHGPLNERQLHYEQAVRAGADRLLALVNDLLDVSRLEGGGFDLSPGPLDLVPVLGHSADEVADEARAKRLRVGLTVDPSLPRVLADRDRLLQVLHHLLSNALKFTPEGGEVEIAAEPCGEGEVRISVRDTGVGLEPAHLSRIWDRFYQADSTMHRAYSGTGLGLTIVKGLVELQGGRVWAESAGLSKGSTFSFTLPAAPRRTMAPAEPAPMPRSAPTVLIVEDEPANREVLRTITETLAGLSTIEASDGFQALDVAERYRPDLILLDLMIPGLDGFEVAKRLKSNHHLADVPILAVSALAHPDDRHRALAAGVDAYLSKPFEPEELTQFLRRLLSRVSSAH